MFDRPLQERSMQRNASLPGRRVVLVAMMVLVTGCNQWEVQAGAPAAIVAEKKPSEIRVQRADSSRLVIVRPLVVGDSIRGRSGAIALAEVVSVEVPSANGLILPLIGVFVVLPLLLLAMCAATDCLSFSIAQ
jgi:hypothetical protein